jgi:hypothetical protein
MWDWLRLTFEDGEKAVSLARDVEKQSATISDDLIHGRSLMMLGFKLVLDNSGHRQEALRHLERAKLKVKGSTLISDALYSIAALSREQAFRGS